MEKPSKDDLIQAIQLLIKNGKKDVEIQKGVLDSMNTIASSLQVMTEHLSSLSLELKNSQSPIINEAISNILLLLGIILEFDNKILEKVNTIEKKIDQMCEPINFPPSLFPPDLLPFS